MEKREEKTRHHLEQLLKKNRGINRERFIALTEAVQGDKLAVFWGAGISLGGKNSKSWKAPFMELMNRIRELYNSEKDRIDLVTSMQINENLNHAEERINCAEYPLAGKYLNIAHDKLRMYYVSHGRGRECFNNTDFNQLLIDSFEYKYDEIEEQDFDNPYGFQSLYYVPFLGEYRLTTNIDECYDLVAKQLNIRDHDYPLPADKELTNQLQEGHTITFALHGSVKATETLVFTKDQYDKVYPITGAEKGPVALLRYIVDNYTVLFLGASLQTDETVKIIKKANPNTAMLIPVVASVPDRFGGDLAVPPTALGFDDPFFYNKDQFFEIPFLLLSLLRHSDKENRNWTSCRWYRIGRNSNQNALDDETIKGIEGLLRPEGRRFRKLKLSSNSQIPPAEFRNRVIQYVFDHYSFELPNADPGWDICVVESYRFNLGGDKRTYQGQERHYSPNHNCPVGNTIYIISPSDDQYPLLKAEDMDRIAEDIKKWRDQLDSNVGIDPFIRVITFQMPGKKEVDSFDRSGLEYSDFVDDFAIYSDQQDVSEEEKNNSLRILLLKMRGLINALLKSAQAGNEKSINMQDEWQILEGSADRILRRIQKPE